MTQPTAEQLEVTQADEWECFQDAAYFDMWCVRRKGERTFGQGFHCSDGTEATALCDLLNTRLATEARMAEAVELLRNWMQDGFNSEAEHRELVEQTEATIRSQSNG